MSVGTLGVPKKSPVLPFVAGFRSRPRRPLPVLEIPFPRGSRYSASDLKNCATSSGIPFAS